MIRMKFRETQFELLVYHFSNFGFWPSAIHDPCQCVRVLKFSNFSNEIQLLKFNERKIHVEKSYFESIIC